jgi:predicted aspartyl protease
MTLAEEYAVWQTEELARRREAAKGPGFGAWPGALGLRAATTRGASPAGSGTHGATVHGAGAPSAHYMTGGSNSEDYLFHDAARSDHRFYVCVELPTPSAGTISFAALVDTGADTLVLPLALATAVGWTTATMTPAKLSTAGGSVTAQQVTGYSFEIDGVQVNEDLLFASTLAHGALCGRRVLLQRFNIGFRPAQWLRTDPIR